MKRTWMLPIVLIYIILQLASPGGTVTAAPPPKESSLAGERAQLHRQARLILECVYRGQPDSALEKAEQFLADHPRDPLPLLITARVMRETFSDQDDDKSMIERSAAPIVDHLKRAISLCDERLDGDDPDERFYFYRGWGWMFKAQIDALSANYWSAGRSAKKGKSDLDRYLRLRPEDPDASGILGTFLYFADTLPSVLKIIKSIFLIPGGDRQTGLELLRFAAANGGMLDVDHEIILSAIYTIFEGRFEEGWGSFSSLQRRYPAYLRLVEPLGVVTSLIPREAREFQRLLTQALIQHLNFNTGTIDWETIHRIEYHRSYSFMFYDAPERAIESFRALIDRQPERPDWLLPLSKINLGMLYANTAQPGRAREMFQEIIETDAMERFHDVARHMLESVDQGEGKLTGVYPRLVTALYNGNTAESRTLIDQFEESAGGTVYFDFYRGELELLSGDDSAAERAYRTALDRRVPEYAQIYQLLAASRLAEIFGVRGAYQTAAELLDEALDYYHKEFLLDMLLKGRKRYYHALAGGDLEPGLAVPVPGDQPQLHAPPLER